LYEDRNEPLASRQVFFWRVVGHFAVASVIVVVSLAAGMWGYEHYEHLAWRDAFLNASMLLGGEGPVDMPRTPAGKLFAGIYALYAGVVFVVAVGIILAPTVHRLLHRFHLDQDADG
jgi:hypothetical protein